MFEQGLLAVVFSSSIMLNLLAACLIIAVSVKLRKDYYIGMLIICLLTIGYQWFSWQYHLAETPSQALYWLSYQTSASMLLLPIWFYTFASWAQMRYASRLFLLFLAISALFIVLNVYSDATFRFNEVDALRTVNWWQAEPISLLTGEQSWWGKAYNLLSSVILLGLLVAAIRLFRRYSAVLASLLISAITLQLVASYIGQQIDAGDIDFIYVEGFAFTFLNSVVCLQIALSLGMQVDRVRQQKAQRQKIEQALTGLAQGFTQNINAGFYSSMLQSLYEVSGAERIYLGILDTKAGESVIRTHTLMVCGKLADNISFSLANSSADIIIGKGRCALSDGAAQHFSFDKQLVDREARGFLGVPLNDVDKTIGVLVLEHGEPLALTNQLREIVDICASRAVAELKREEVELSLRQTAFVDYATKLPNQAGLFEFINKLFNQHKAKETESLLMLFDIDRFTEINRNYGYDGGEQVLREIGYRLQTYQSDDLYVARNGGDEFAIIIKELSVSPHSMLRLHWEGVRALIRKPLRIGNVDVLLDCSMGAVVFPQQTQNRYDVIRAVETALQQAKKDGRSQYRLFEPGLLAELDRQRDLEVKLKSALAHDDELTMVYQPKVDASGRCVGAEALLRWYHGELGIISPSEFIPIAESSALIYQLGHWVLNKVCQQIRQWKDSPCESAQLIKVAVNVSAIQFAQDEFIQDVIQVLERYDLTPECIEFELTETGLLQSIQQTSEKLHQLKSLGFSIALDDFGTGYSSLAYLRELPLNVLKIDKSFVDNMADESTAELIRSIVAIGKYMHLSIVAEGTESEQQVQELIGMGCEYFQGYFFSKPLAADVFIQWCEQKHLTSGERHQAT